jgi:hypothetical protein
MPTDLFDFERRGRGSAAQTLRQLQLPFDRAIRLRNQAIKTRAWERLKKTGSTRPLKSNA